LRLKILKKLRTASLDSEFTGSYKKSVNKKTCTTQSAFILVVKRIAWQAIPKNQQRHFFLTYTIQSRASAEKFPGGGGNEKRLKNSKKRPKNTTLKPLQGEGQRKKRPKIAKKKTEK